MTTLDPFAPVAPVVELPPVELPADVKPSTGRPTTRAERRARSAAAAAKRAAAAKDDKPKASKSAPRRASLESRLAGSLATVGTGIMVAGAMTSPAVQADGLLVVQHSANIAAALDKVAKNDPRVARTLERMLTVGTYSALIAATAPVLIGVAANHNLIPAEVADLLGTTLVPSGLGVALPDAE